MAKPNPTLLAKAAAAAKKAVFTPRSWKIEAIYTMEAFVKLTKGVSDLRLADKKAEATYEVEYEGENVFYKLLIPLTTGEISEVKPSKRIRDEHVAGDTFPVKNLRALLCSRGEDVTWTFDDVNELEKEIAKLGENK